MSVRALSKGFEPLARTISLRVDVTSPREILVGAIEDFPDNMPSPRPAVAVLAAGRRIHVATFAAHGRWSCTACLVRAICQDLSRESGGTGRSPRGRTQGTSCGSALAAGWVTEIVAARWALADDEADLVDIVDATDRRVQREALLPRPGCPRCDGLPVPPELLASTAQSGARAHALPTLAESIAARCHGERLGLLSKPLPDLQMPLAASTLWLRVPGAPAIATLGRGKRYLSVARSMAAPAATGRR